MPYSRGQAEALARAIREDRERAKSVMGAMAELTEPYGTAASVNRIRKGEADAFDYLAAIPLVGIPARAIKGVMKSADELADMAASSKFLDLPKEDQDAINALVEAKGYPRDTAARVYYGVLEMDDASRLQRAREQGFDIDEVVYRGSNSPIQSNIGMTFSTADPRVAATYLDNPQDIIDTYPEDTPLSEMRELQGLAPAVYPMYRRPGMQLDVDVGVDADTGAAMNLDYEETAWHSIPGYAIPDIIRRSAKPGAHDSPAFNTDEVVRGAYKEGYDSIRFYDIDDRGSDVWGEFGDLSGNIDPDYGDVIQTTADVMADKPQNLRSIYAAFDPYTKDQTNIMAGVAGVGLTTLIAQLLRQMEEEKTRETSI